MKIPHPTNMIRKSLLQLSCILLFKIFLVKTLNFLLNFLFRFEIVQKCVQSGERSVSED